MFSISKRLILAAAVLASGFAFTQAQASTIATASFDTDSYVAFTTDNRFSPEITIGPQAFIPNANFGIIEFNDLSGVPLTGDKYLVLNLEFFRTGGGPGDPPVDTTIGNSTLKVVGLAAPYSDYEALTSGATAWYNTYIGNPTAADTASATNAGLLYFNVTDVVDGWLADPSTNHGFGVTVIAGTAVELSASEDFIADPGTIGPTLSSVPEPGSLALLSALGLLGLRRRR